MKTKSERITIAICQSETKEYRLLYDILDKKDIKIIDLNSVKNNKNLFIIEKVNLIICEYSQYKSLKNSYKINTIPKIFTVKQIDSQKINKYFDLGGIDYFIKPLNILEIRTKLNMHLKRIICCQKLITNIDNQTNTKNKNELMSLENSSILTSLGSLAGGIAHDFNNVLAAIQGYSELGKSIVEENSQISEYLDIIIEASNRAADLSRQILNFSRSDEELGEILNPVPIIKQTLKLLRRTISTNIEISHIEKKFKGQININTTEIYQICLNLGINAYHAMENTHEGLLEFKTEAVFDKNLNQRFFQLSVKDTGSGISKKNIEKIFKKYFTTKEKGKGTGLGLSLIKTIVDNRNGKIKIKSEVKKGTTLIITFPIIKSDQTKNTNIKSKIEKVKKTKKILLLDDEIMITKLYKRFLESIGYKVIVFNNSKKAYKSFIDEPQKYDMIISDNQMPLMTGEELAIEVLKVRKDIPIILFTGYSQNLSEEDAYKIGIKKYLIKPISLTEFYRIINNIFEKE